jgi:hypothetical protein
VRAYLRLRMSYCSLVDSGRNGSPHPASICTRQVLSYRRGLNPEDASCLASVDARVKVAEESLRHPRVGHPFPIESPVVGNSVFALHVGVPVCVCVCVCVCVRECERVSERVSE